MASPVRGHLVPTYSGYTTVVAPQPIDPYTAKELEWDEAARTANMVRLQELDDWRVANGHPMFQGSMWTAAVHGKTHVIQWMHQRGYPWEHDIVSHFHHDAQFLTYLQANGCPLEGTKPYNQLIQEAATGRIMVIRGGS